MKASEYVYRARARERELQALRENDDLVEAANRARHNERIVQALKRERAIARTTHVWQVAP
jgi:hypothetical protein